MREVIYVTEPDVIDTRAAARLLGDRYELCSGDTSFSGAVPDNCTALLIRSATVVTPSIKDFFPNLRSIIRVGTGLDNIDMAFCDQENIRVFNAPGANADAASDYVVCMMLVALRKINTLSPQDVISWNRFKFRGRSLSNQTVGIVGFGNIGKLVYQKLKGFSCKGFLVYDPLYQAGDLPDDVQCMPSIDDVLAGCDIVTLHLPLLPETHHVINSRNLALMPENAILINAARGGIVDETDVAEAAKVRGLIYVADTVEDEPEVNPVLLQDNVIITPHIASLTRESESDMVRIAIENFLGEVSVSGRLVSLAR